MTYYYLITTLHNQKIKLNTYFTMVIMRYIIIYMSAIGIVSKNEDL